MKGDRERCLKAGMDGYISKPIRAEELLSMIKSIERPRDPVADFILYPAERLGSWRNAAWAASIFAARMKSLSLSPSILWVKIFASTCPQERHRSG